MTRFSTDMKDYEKNSRAGNDNPAFTSSIEDHDGKIEKGAEKINLDVQVDEIQRAQWGGGMEFLMSCIAMSVGLGNIWRFPFTAYENGGGAFLIPYIIVLILVGRPMYYMEMALGQFASSGSIQMFGAYSKALTGIGYGQVLGSVCVASYYSSLMCLTLLYLVNSFTSDLPWSECRPEWHSAMASRNITSCVPSFSTIPPINANGTISASSSELYFTLEVLKEKTQIQDGLGMPDWKLTLCLFVSWLVTFFVSAGGVKSSGKASYFLALFPYVIMIALLIRACTLEGADQGMLYFVKPQWEKLASADVWYAAVTQCFFSLNVGFGTVTMYASYNNFEHNINRDAMVVTTLDTFTSLLAGTTIFGILGNLAHELNVPVEQVINSGGTALAFISYPEAIAKFQQVPWLFSILFFFMLFVLGVGSLVALQSAANTAILDRYPHLKSWHVSGGTAIAFFLVALIYVTPGGQFMLVMVDHFGGTFVVFVFAMMEIYVVLGFYGVENLCDDLEFMLKQKVGIYWRWVWAVIMPSLLTLILLYFLVKQSRLSYGSFEIADKALICGWMIVAGAFLNFIFIMVYQVYKNRNLEFPRMLTETFSFKNWGPRNVKTMTEWRIFKQNKQDERALRKKTWLQNKILFLSGK